MMRRALQACAIGALGCLGGVGCHETPINPLEIQIGYRDGTVDSDFTSNGERGTVQVSEVFWAGSVEQVGDGFVHHPDDIFIELQNKFTRPVYLTDWQLQIETASTNERLSARGDARSRVRFRIPERANGLPVQPNEYVIIAARTDGAFPDADFVIPELDLPSDRWAIGLMDIDNRLIEGGGDEEEDVFAGAWDGVVSRSMERVQLIFSNRGNTEVSWHTYSYNDWSNDLHQTLRSRIAEPYRARTFATPGQPNSPDYSGNTSAGSTD
ncbi:MAG: hypothetical protein ACI81R_000549 [Bradymonadia bacterium]|jgi:hypothetical protein